MNEVRYFLPEGNRYIFDFGMCSCGNGFCQVDTSQDAEWFGTWTNPEKLIIISYAEGDVVKTTYETKEEYKAAMLKLAKFNYDNDYRCKIDVGLGQQAINNTMLFTELGLEHLLYKR